MKALQKNNAVLYQGLQIFTYGSVEDYQAWRDSDPTDLDDEACLSKMRYLTISTMAMEATTLSYDSLAAKLAIP